MKSLQILTSLHSSVRSSIDFLSHSTANQMCEWLLWVYCLTIKTLPVEIFCEAYLMNLLAV